MYNEKLIGERIAEAREKRGLSRTEFADVMLVSAQAVGKWERGESLPDIITFKKMADILEKDVNYFLEGEKADNSNRDNINQKGEENIKKPKWDLSLANWKDADFSGLKNISDKFKCANILRCKFCNSDLSGIKFKANNVRKCDFSNANLFGSQFLLSNIPDNNFSGCNFKNASIKMCDLHGSDFSEADFTEAEISGTVLNKNNLKDAKFLRTNFSYIIFSDITITSDFIDCTFTNCTFKNIIFEGITFKNTFFKNQKNKNVEFVNCKADNISYSFLKHSKAPIEDIKIIE